MSCKYSIREQDPLKQGLKQFMQEYVGDIPPDS